MLPQALRRRLDQHLPARSARVDDRSGNVILEFDSLEQAERYYHSPEYQAARAEREHAGLAEIVAVEGAE